MTAAGLGRAVVPVVAAVLGVSAVAACGTSSTTTDVSSTRVPSTDGSASDTAADAAPALRSLAPAGFAVGTAYSDSADALANASYQRVVARDFSSITPENQFKWRVVEPTRGHLDFTAADAAVATAERNGQAVRGHTLLWSDALPDWVPGAISTCTSARTLLHDHIIAEVGHFKGRVGQWDVVNEPFTATGTLREDNPFLKVCGVGIIGDAFRWAHVADPAAKLYLNDDGELASGAKADAQYALVKSLVQQGVPINGVGFQSHLTLVGVPKGAAHQLQRLADLGLDVAITEADVRMATNTGGPSDTDLHNQALVYAQLVRLCLQQPRCVGFTVWGFSDRWSWVAKAMADRGWADLMDANLVPRPAWAAVAQALAQGR